MIETKKVTLVNSNPEVEFHGEMKAEKEGSEKPSECFVNVYRPFSNATYPRHSRQLSEHVNWNCLHSNF